ncbi:MAG: hypothetical protein ACTSRU_17415 [Candidatus Hodarchaeales archaeon]
MSLKAEKCPVCDGEGVVFDEKIKVGWKVCPGCNGKCWIVLVDERDVERFPESFVLV